MSLLLEQHKCTSSCPRDVWLFKRPLIGRVDERQENHYIPVEDAEVRFPPLPLDVSDKAEIVRDWVNATSAAALAESPCATCAQLQYTKDLIPCPLDSPALKLIFDRARDVLPVEFVADPVHLLHRDGVDAHRDVAMLCSTCLRFLHKHKQIPPLSLRAEESLLRRLLLPFLHVR